MKEYPYTPDLSLLVIALLHHYLGNMKIAPALLVLLGLIGISSARYLTYAILYHDLF